MGVIKLPAKSIDFFKNNLDEIFISGELAEGKWNKQLSDYIVQITNAQTAIPTSSNGSGIVALLGVYRHYYGRNKVLIQSNTMCGVKTMVLAGGCHLLGYIDCQVYSLMPSFNDVKKVVFKLTAQEKNELVILLSHIGGIINPDIENIANFCDEENIILIEDCAHSFGATLNDKHSGLFGDAGVYSFYSTKAIPAGEGGLIVTKNITIGNMMHDFSIYDRFKQELEIGFNNRISEIQALLVYSVVSEWKSIIESKKLIAAKYIPACEELNINYISQANNGQIGNYYKFVVYDPYEPILKRLNKLVTKTSSVYDYSIGVTNSLAFLHACLPIWYDQDENVTDQVVTELFASLKK